MRNSIGDKMCTPFLSVIIPCYNASQTIIDTLLSFENEFSCDPSLDWEIIVVNDGSTDQTTMAVSSLNNPRIKYLENRSRSQLFGAINSILET